MVTGRNDRANIGYSKTKPYRNEKYLQFIRDHFCAYCGGPHPSAHHVRRHYWGAGAGQKPHDYCSLPLCEERACHSPQIENQLPVEALIIGYMLEYIKLNFDKRDIIECLMAFIESKRLPDNRG